MRDERPSSAAAIERVRLSDTIYGRLLNEIVGAGYQIGDRLPTEHQLAEHFAVSRPVVREALRRLQTDGIVVSRQGSGTYVQRKPSQRVVELTGNAPGLGEVLQGFELRLSLEPLSARLAARNRSDAQLDAILSASAPLRDAVTAGL